MSEDPEIIGDWVRERVLGCGGFGIVTLWKNNKTCERVAIKKYRGDNDGLSQKHKDRWTQEVEMMQRINNENIVSFQRLPSFFETELTKFNPSKLPMLSMEYCTQGDLRGVLARSENCCGLPESDVRYILKDLMNAVSYLHSLKITHRDLKPENIVLQTHERPNGIIYKLIDLGYAKELDAKSICASFVGTLQYLAPELMYSKSYSCSVDYWSMGLVAFEIICGTRPFLPNMSPAQWMFHVHKKSSDTICICQQNENADSIESSREIFSENHVSSCFKREIEKWLRLALEYNPKKRGYINFDPESPNNNLAIFSSLKSLLEKKIITVFVVYISEFCSYEIDDCTLVATLQGWIERDTKICRDDQILISPKCDNIDPSGFATQFFNETYSESMLYVFKKTEILMMDIKPRNIPDLVREMLSNASKELQYHFQKRSYAHALFFIFNENKLYNSVLDGCSLKIKHMLHVCDQTSHSCRTLNTNIEKLNAQKEFSKELLDFDVQQYLKNYSQKASHWTDSFRGIVEKIDKLHGVCNQITIRHESAYRRATMLSVTFNKDFSKHNNHDLNELLDEAISCYSVVKSRSKDKRSKPENCKTMTKLVYQVLKSRDKLLRHSMFRNLLQLIVDINYELEKMVPPLNAAMSHIEKYQKEVLADNMARQSKIWEFTIKQKTKPKGAEPDYVHSSKVAKSTISRTNLSQSGDVNSQGANDSTSPKVNFILGNPNVQQQSTEDYGTPISLEKPLHFILGDPQKNSSLESTSSYHSSCESLPPPERNTQSSLQDAGKYTSRTEQENCSVDFSKSPLVPKSTQNSVEGAGKCMPSREESSVGSYNKSPVPQGRNVQSYPESVGKYTPGEENPVANFNKSSLPLGRNVQNSLEGTEKLRSEKEISAICFSESPRDSQNFLRSAEKNSLRDVNRNGIPQCSSIINNIQSSEGRREIPVLQINQNSNDSNKSRISQSVVLENNPSTGVVGSENDSLVPQKLQLPAFRIGQPASDIINYNLSLRHELQEKTNESYIKYKSILGDTFDFDFLHE